MDSSPSCDRIVLRFHSIFLYMKETTSKRTNSLHSFLLKYLLYTTNIFSIFQANTSGVARKEDWGGQPRRSRFSAVSGYSAGGNVCASH